ncbi:MAG: peptide ABC transporter substrate-binding protein [Candidatus Eremiobacteraeota bacterium]|nr:peptide ABC transporter substrate-binding protein [Candidatus Eremiobacteraeota bacterium]
MTLVRRALAFACAFSFAVTGAPRGAAAGDRPLRIGLVQQPNSLDPLHAIQFYENYLAEAVFSALTVIDDRGAVSADLAERVPTRANGGISADGKTIVYHLRRGVRWQDGVPLTSHDVAFTFALMRDPKTNFPETSVYSIVDRLDTPDDRTVVLHLHSAWADATSQLFVGGEDGSIVPEHVLRGVADIGSSRFESAPVGSGPYAVERWDRGSRIVLRANPSYFRGRPAIDRIDVEFVPDQNTIALRVMTGELDFSPQLPQTAAAQLVPSAAIRQTTAPTYNDIQLGFNTRNAPFDDARVRRALAIAVDRERLVSAVYHGFAVAADDLVPPQSPAHVHDPSVRLGGDPAGAAALLDRAGWSRGPNGMRAKSGTPLAFVLTVPSGYVALVNAAVQVQAAWHALGVDADIKTVPSNVMLAPAIGLLPKGEFAAYLVTYGYETSPDRADTLTGPGIPPAGRNYPRYADRDVNAWTAQARATLEDAPRNALYAKISKRVRADAPLVPLLWQQQVYAYTSKLTGLRPETVNSDFWNVYDWRLSP